MNRHIYLILIFVLLLTAPAVAQTQYILGTSPATLDSVTAKYGLTVVEDLSSQGGVYLVTAPATMPRQFLRQITADPAVTSFEPDATLGAPEAEAVSRVQVDVGQIQAVLSDTSTVTFAGATVRNIYVNQAASSLIRLGLNTLPLTSNTPIVAVIDTGVDPDHPALAGVLLPGYDFTRHQAGTPSELLDLNGASASAISLSAVAAVAQKSKTVLRQSTVVILDQSTVVILDGNSPLPSDFGHGTMVAGLIHLVAPMAKIMPLKAFNSDGSANLSDIIHAIYYAADNGATVISMSFDSETPSPDLETAIAYAQSKGAVCVAAGGNEGEREMAYPAGFSGVIGVGSTTPTDGRSAFSNYGISSIDISAPGEALITTYPGNNYAAAWGTSFSTALISGGVALLSQAASEFSSGVAMDALSHGHPLDESLGLGESRLDVFASLNAIQQHQQ